MDLDDAIYDQVTELSERANLLLEKKKFFKAVTVLEEALALLPPPQRDWEAWTWLTATMGDAFYLQKQYPTAGMWFNEALNGPDGLGNPFIHLRLGQIARRCGNDENAVDELLRAYMGDGEAVFEGASEDLRFLKSRVDL